MNEYIVVEEKSFTNGMRGLIVYDPDPQPYDGDTLGRIAYLKRSRYTLGTEAVSEERMRHIEEGIEQGIYIGLPVFAYVHSGVTIRTGQSFPCPWDSGRSGFVYVDRADALAEFKDEESVLNCLRSEVETCNAYLSGEVFGWIVLDVDGEELESCWGFYGAREHEYMMSEIHATVSFFLTKSEEEKQEAQYWAERDVVTEAT